MQPTTGRPGFTDAESRQANGIDKVMASTSKCGAILQWSAMLPEKEIFR
jgi:hypothetical protein